MGRLNTRKVFSNKGGSMKYVWLIYLQFLFVVGQFNGKKNWIDKQILLCYNKLDKLKVNYIKIHKLDQLDNK